LWNNRCRPLRSISRLREPLLLGESRKRELLLASARLLLALGCALALYFEPKSVPAQEFAARSIVAGFLGVSSLCLWIARRSKQPTITFQVLTHVTDLMWPALMGLWAQSMAGPRTAILLFVVVAAASRWAFAETLATATVAVLLLWGARILRLWGADHAQRFFDAPAVSSNDFVTWCLCLLFLGVLLGYWAEREKAFRLRLLAMGQVLNRASSETTFEDAIERALRSVRMLASARRIVLVARHEQTGGTFLWTLNSGGGFENEPVARGRLLEDDLSRYFFAGPAQSWQISGRHREETPDRYKCLVIASDGRRLPDQELAFPGAFFVDEPFQSLFAVPFAIPDEWTGRVFLLDCENVANPLSDLSFVQSLVWGAVPVLNRLYVQSRLRARARADERLRVAHQLHDGLLQSLISVEMEMELVRRRATQAAPGVDQELRRLKELLHREVLSARSLMEQFKLPEVGPKQMLGIMADLVERFQRETGIAADFLCGTSSIDLPQHVCREITCILQEALTNVRKHSGARHVKVRLSMEKGCWGLSVADDGRGFAFSGRLSEIECDANCKAPVVLSERARAIGADLDIESVPGGGTCVELRLRPQESYV